MTNDLFLAILSMDAYNRGYNAGIEGLSDAIGTQIGNATISNRSSSLPNSPEVNANFYAVAYTLDNGETVISYRGTDDPSVLSSGSDVWQGWITGAGIMGPQAYLAADFYQAVTGTATTESELW